MLRPSLAQTLVLLALPAWLIACEEGWDCDSAAVASVTVSVFDEAGDPFAPDRVSYAVNGGAAAPCDPLPDGTEFLCGVEEVGTFDIRIFVNGFEVASETVDVDLRADGCHVEPVFLDVVI